MLAGRAGCAPGALRPQPEPAPSVRTRIVRRRPVFDRVEGAPVTDRRRFLALASGTFASAFIADSFRQAALAAEPAASDITKRLDALFDAFMEERFAAIGPLGRLAKRRRQRY